MNPVRRREEITRGLLTPAERRILNKCAREPWWFFRMVVGKKVPLTSATPEFHKQMWRDAIDRSRKKQVFRAFRDSAKTTNLAVGAILWHMLVSDYAYEREAFPKFFCVGSKTLYPHAERILDTIKWLLETSDFIHQMWGNLSPQKTTHDSKTKWTTKEVVLATGDSILARGASQQIRGMNFRLRRFYLVIWDDPEDNKNTRSKDALDHNYKILTDEIVPAIDKTSGHGVWVVANPINVQAGDCLVERLWALVEEKPFQVLDDEGNVLAESGWYGRTYPIVEPAADGSIEHGTPLWPERFSLEDVLAMKGEAERDGDLAGFYAERMCQVNRSEDAYFDTYGYYRGELFRHHEQPFLRVTHRGIQSADSRVRKESLRELDEPLIMAVNVFTGCDLAASTSKRADKSAIMTTAVTKRMHRYALPMWVGREKPYDVAMRIVDYIGRYRPTQAWVENNGFQEAVRQIIHKHYKNVAPFTSMNNKNDENKSLQAYFAQEQVWLLEGMDAFEHELRGFDPDSDRNNDDVLDAWRMSNAYAYPPIHAFIEGEGPPKRKTRAHSWKAA